MMWPVLTKVRYELLGGLLRSRAVWGQLAISLIANWVIGPAIMVSNAAHPRHAMLLCCKDRHAGCAPSEVSGLEAAQIAARRIAGLPCHRCCPVWHQPPARMDRGKLTGLHQSGRAPKKGCLNGHADLC